MPANDEVVVSIDDVSAPIAETTVDVGGGEPNAAVKELASQFKEIQAQVAAANAERDTERRAREVSDAALQRAQGEVEEARGRASSSEYDTIVSALDSATTRATAAEEQYRQAFEAGDGAAMAKAQRAMARAEAESLQYGQAKSDLEARSAVEKDRPKPAARTEQTRPVPSSDPVEQFASKATAKTAEWARAHPEYIRDATKNAKLTAGHFDAVSTGLTPDTPEYFSHVERFIGLTSPHQTTRRIVNSAPVAPANGNGGQLSGGKREVKLTKAEVEAANDGTLVFNYDDPSGKKRWVKGQPLGTQEYARRKLIMQEQGLYDKS